MSIGEFAFATQRDDGAYSPAVAAPTRGKTARESLPLMLDRSSTIPDNIFTATPFEPPPDERGSLYNIS